MRRQGFQVGSNFVGDVALPTRSAPVITGQPCPCCDKQTACVVGDQGVRYPCLGPNSQAVKLAPGCTGPGFVDRREWDTRSVRGMDGCIADPLSTKKAKSSALQWSEDIRRAPFRMPWSSAMAHADQCGKRHDNAGPDPPKVRSMRQRPMPDCWPGRVAFKAHAARCKNNAVVARRAPQRRVR